METRWTSVWLVRCWRANNASLAGDLIFIFLSTSFLFTYSTCLLHGAGRQELMVSFSHVTIKLFVEGGGLSGIVRWLGNAQVYSFPCYSYPFSRFLARADMVVLLILPLLVQQKGKNRDTQWSVQVRAHDTAVMLITYVTSLSHPWRPVPGSDFCLYISTWDFFDLNFYKDKRNVYLHLVKLKRTFWLARDIGCFQTFWLPPSMVRSPLCCVQVPSLCSSLKDSPSLRNL